MDETRDSQFVGVGGSALLLCILAAWANLRSSCHEDRPAAFVTVNDGLAQHAPDQRAAAPAAAGTGADASIIAIEDSHEIQRRG